MPQTAPAATLAAIPSIAVRGRKDYPIHAPVYGIFNDVDLAGVVCLLSRAFPHDLHTRLFSRCFRARVYALPEEMRDAFRNDGYNALPFSLLVSGRGE
jgi:hypothetical protein